MRALVEPEAPSERRGHVEVRVGLRATGDLELAVVHHAQYRGLAERLHERDQIGLRERAQIGRRGIGQGPQLRSETEAGVRIAHHEAVGVQGEQHVAEGALGHPERPRKLTDALWTATVGEGAQHPRSLVDGRDRSGAPRTLRHTRTGDSTPVKPGMTPVKLA